MEILKEQKYKKAIPGSIHFFKKQFAVEIQSTPNNYFFEALAEIPNTFYSAIDVYKKNKFFIRFLLVIIQDGELTEIVPEEYSEHLEHLCRIPNPKGEGQYYKQGIAIITTDSSLHPKELAFQKQLKLDDCSP